MTGEGEALENNVQEIVNLTPWMVPIFVLFLFISRVSILRSAAQMVLCKSFRHLKI